MRKIFREHIGNCYSMDFSEPGFTHIMAGAVEPEHVKANANASDIELKPEEITFVTNAAEKLKAKTIDGERENARRIFEKLAKDRTPVILWGAGVTADYIIKTPAIRSVQYYCCG